MGVTAMTPTAASALDRITALTIERGLLWAKASRERLSDAERGRLLDIRDQLESLWAQRRQEKAGINLGRLPDVVAPAHDARRGARFAYRRSRADRRAGATMPQSHIR